MHENDGKRERQSMGKEGVTTKRARQPTIDEAQPPVKMGPFKSSVSLHRRLRRVLSTVEPDNLSRVGKLVSKVERGILSLQQLREYFLHSYNVDVDFS